MADLGEKELGTLPATAALSKIEITDDQLRSENIALAGKTGIGQPLRADSDSDSDDGKRGTAGSRGDSDSDQADG